MGTQDGKVWFLLLEENPSGQGLHTVGPGAPETRAAAEVQAMENLRSSKSQRPLYVVQVVSIVQPPRMVPGQIVKLKQ